MDIYIETERLILREFIVNDVEELQSICSKPYILKWMPDWKRTVECGFTKLNTKMILNSGDTEEKQFYYYRIYNRYIDISNNT